MTFQEIVHRRLINQHILHNRYRTPAEVLAWMGAIQGQDYPGALWSLGLRLRNATNAGIEQAFLGKTIVRTWAMRGTLHIVAASDLRWLLTLLAPRIIAGNAGRYRELELDEKILSRSTRMMVRALEEGRQLNRKELLGVLERKGISTEGQRAAYILQRASLDGLVCQGVMHRNVPTFMLTDNLPKTAGPMDREEALAELTRRYFQSRSPASLQDFAWWSGLTTADARVGMSLVDVKIKETCRNSQIGKDGASTVHLLPGFDEYLLGYKERTAMLDPLHRNMWSPGNNGMFNPVIVINGHVAGIWNRKINKDSVMIEIRLFDRKRGPRKRDLAASAIRFGTFLERPVEMRYF